MPAQTQKKRNTALLNTPRREESTMLRISLWPGLIRQISGVTIYFLWNSTPMKSQSVNVAANPDNTTARRKRVQFIGHLLAADCSAFDYLAATNVMQTGAGTSAISPVGLSAPMVESMRKMTMLLDSWLAARRNLPVGSIAKLRGVFPMVGYSSFRWRVPLAGSMEKAEIVSMPPRFEAYRNFPFGCTAISAASFGPL